MRTRFLFPTSALTLSVIGMLACSSSGGSSPQPEPEAIAVSLNPPTTTLNTSATQQFNATVTNAANTTVTWAVTEGASGGSVNSSGLYTAPATISGASATFHVVATSVADGTKSATATVTVNMPQIVTVSLNPTSASLGLGGTQQFQATVGGSPNTAVTWALQEGTTGGSVNGSGLYTAPSSVSGSGATFHLVATSVADSSKSATASIQVNVLPIIASFTATPATITPGQASTLSWSVGNVTNVSINQGVGTVAATGSIQVTPASSMVYTMTASNGNGQANRSATVTVATATHNLSLLAGNLGGPGNQDGPTSAARFYRPNSVTSDPSGNLYIADSSNNIIRKILPDGTVSTLAGSPGQSGTADGTGSSARFNGPYGIVWDGTSGNLFVCEYYGHRVRRVTPAGVVTTFAGASSGSPGTDGPGATATFGGMYALAADSSGNLYAAEGDSHTIRKIAPNGTVSTLAGFSGQSGSVDGLGGAARFYLPVGVAVDSASNVYVGDFGNRTIRKIAPDGTVTTLAGTAGASGSADGQGSVAQFGRPYGLAMEPSGNIWIADQGLGRVRKVTPGGLVSTIAGGSSNPIADGQGAAAGFNIPTGLGLHSSGDLIVCDMGNATLRRVTPMGLVSTFAGTPPLIGSVDAIGASARFSRPEGVAADASGNVYVADRGNVTLRKIASDGTVSTLAGLAGSGGLVNGQGSTARFNGITGVASTAAGTVYVADYYNHAIRSVASNGTVATFAGGSLGSLDGQGTAAQFNYPSGVAVDTSGSVYVADSYNQVIRRISPAGAVTTLAGSPGQSGSTDGQGNAARFSFPIAVAPDSAGNVYVCDRENSTIRKVAPDGTVSTLAGSAGQVGNVDGTGAAARFNKPLALSLDPISGNLYIADSGNSLVRMVTPSGVVTTVAGQPGVNGGLLGTLPGVISQPLGITVAPDGRIHFSTQNGVVTMVR